MFIQFKRHYPRCRFVRKCDRGSKNAVSVSTLWSCRASRSAFTHRFPSAEGLMTASGVFSRSRSPLWARGLLASESGVLVSEEDPHGFWWCAPNWESPGSSDLFSRVAIEPKDPFSIVGLLPELHDTSFYLGRGGGVGWTGSGVWGWVGYKGGPEACLSLVALCRCARTCVTCQKMNDSSEDFGTSLWDLCEIIFIISFSYIIVLK